jgi:putative SOS response-associated peptidase YedK
MTSAWIPGTTGDKDSSGDSEQRWLDPKADPEKLRSLLLPSPSEAIEAYEVSTVVNSPANDVPACVAKLAA